MSFSGIWFKCACKFESGLYRGCRYFHNGILCVWFAPLVGIFIETAGFFDVQLVLPLHPLWFFPQQFLAIPRYSSKCYSETKRTWVRRSRYALHTWNSNIRVPSLVWSIIRLVTDFSQCNFHFMHSLSFFEYLRTNCLTVVRREPTRRQHCSGAYSGSRHGFPLCVWKPSSGCDRILGLSSLIRDHRTGLLTLWALWWLLLYLWYCICQCHEGFLQRIPSWIIAWTFSVTSVTGTGIWSFEARFFQAFDCNLQQALALRY